MDQLWFIRESHNKRLRPCCRKNDCDALGLHGAPGPLCIYLSPDEEQKWRESGEEPSSDDRLCLVCIRVFLHAQAELAKMTAPVTAGSSPLFTAPFTNLVDVPGGYSSNAIAVGPASKPDPTPHITSSNVVGSFPWPIKYCPERKSAYVDQSAAIFRPGQPFQGRT